MKRKGIGITLFVGIFLSVLVALVFARAGQVHTARPQWTRIL